MEPVGANIGAQLFQGNMGNVSPGQKVGNLLIDLLCETAPDRPTHADVRASKHPYAWEEAIEKGLRGVQVTGTFMPPTKPDGRSW